MHISPIALAVALGASLAMASSCSEISGNYYCNPVTAVAYENVGFSGSYDDVTSMDDCTCSTSSTSFSGSLAPMNEDISLHFRGPMQIKQVAVYSTSSQSASTKIKKRNGHHVHEKRTEHNKRELHLHEKQHAVHHEKRAIDIVTEIVTVYETVYENADGIATSTTVAWSPESVVYSSTADNTPAETPAISSTIALAENHVDQSTATYQSQWDHTQNWQSQSWTDVSSASPTTTFVVSTTTSSEESSSSSTSSSATSTPSSSTSSWSRFAYYNSEQGVSNGLTFLNNLGGTNGSGTWSSCWGSSLSYCNTDGVTAASDAQVLGDVSLPSNAEIIIFTDTPCTDSSCGYYREGIPAFEGFTGDTKLFLLEFSMPSDTSSDASYNIDMPAVWFLNGKIPRTQQYGSCSCWNSGCGEFDAFEVLSTGSQYLTTTLHTWQGTDNTYGGGGTSDYFTRPTDSTMKAAVLFDGNSQSIYLLELDSSTNFDDSISADLIAQWLSASATVISIPS
ncbi:putative TOS1-like glycosyl hydrolase-domain-containing protein [Lipomyces chichibuensis]|uniref:putative TOS1-like glycosyl hydrolase-domain-containing protein n=1 Tax=Lipomyces chichibuensis TaxID=1546026 RepID=UPI003343A6CA